MSGKNSRIENVKVDINALRITDQENRAFEFSQEEGQSIKFRMVGYSGKIIKGHWWWGNLAIDLGGISFKKPKFPILRDHNTDREMAFTKKPQVSQEEGLVFTEKEVTFLENEEVDGFIKNSKKGFPYQASISGRPSVIEQVEDGSSVEVNGYTLKGPGTVWRKTEFKECSVCVFGYDDQTVAQAFQQSGQHVDIEVESIRSERDQENETEVLSMDLEKLKEESPEEYEVLMAQAADAAQAAAEVKLTDEHTTQLAEKDKTISSLTAEKDGLSQDLTKTGDRVLALEKKDILRTEADMDSKASFIWKTALAKSGLPEWLHAKVQKHVTRDKFMKEGVFNEATFTEAVEAEITDWASHNSSNVEGFGIQVKTPEGDQIEKFQADTMVERMLGYVGQSSEAAH